MKNKKVFILNLISLLCLFSFLSCNIDFVQTVEECTISYISKEGQNYNEEKIVPSGYSVRRVDLFELSADGYEFLGWFNKDAKVELGDRITKDCVFTAKWKEDKTAPNDVSNLSILEGDKKVVLTWTLPNEKDLNGIEISMEPREGTLINPIVLSKGVTSFTVGNLKNNTPYTFKIRTFDNNNNYSNGISSKPITLKDLSDKTPPSEVSIKSITAKDGKALIEWKNPLEDDLFGIELSATPNEGTLTYPVILTKENTSFYVSNLTNGITYTFKIRTIDNSLNYSHGVTQEATPSKSSGDITPPNEVVLTIDSAKDGIVELSWTKPSDIDLKGYRLSASPSEGTLKNPITLDKEVTNFTVSGLSNDKTYTFSIKTFDDNLNYSIGSSQVTSLTDTSDKTPPSEVELSIISSQNGIVELSWTKPSDIDLKGYKLTASPNEGTLKNPITLDKYVTNLTVGGLSNDKLYTFTIQTFDNSFNLSKGISKDFIIPKEIENILPSDITLHEEISIVDSIQDGSSSQNGIYVLFGDYPQSIKDSNVTIDESKTFLINNWECYKGSDNSYYVKKIAKGPNTSYQTDNFFSNGEKVIDGNEYYFKFEPIKWRLLSDISINDKMIISDKILIGNYFYKKIETRNYNGKIIQPNDYEYSNIRAFLNGLDGSNYNVNNYKNNGFIDKAFTLRASNQILQTVVDNSKEQTYGRNQEVNNFLYDFNQSNTLDKVFLLSRKECTDDKLGFLSYDELDPNRVKKISDFALADGIISRKNQTGIWISRSPSPLKHSEIRSTTDDGNCFHDHTAEELDGIVPVIKTQFIYNNKDKTPPSEVSSVSITPQYGKALISWTNPTDDDFMGVELSATPNEGTLTYPIIVTKGTTSFEVSNLGNGATYTFKLRALDNSLNYSTGITKEVTLKKTYTVTFNENGHGTTPEKITGIKEGEKITPPLNFVTKDNATFEGWYKDSSCNTLWDFNNDTVNNDITLYAKWRNVAIGDVIFKDGLFISPNIILETQKDQAIAVVCGFNSNQEPLGLGLHKCNDMGFYWVEYGNSLETKFTDIVCTPSKTGEGAANTATFTGDIDGSNNWDVICTNDPKGSSTEYLGFNWANNYGTDYYLPEAYKYGWYIPSIKELTDIYRNREIIDKVLHDIKCDKLEFGGYWSSSQYDNINNEAWFLDFRNGTLDHMRKDTATMFRCIRAF